MSANEQIIIIYSDPIHGSIKKYTTAYNIDQQEYYFMKCLEKFGKKAGVRAVSAKRLSAG